MSHADVSWRRGRASGAAERGIELGLAAASLTSVLVTIGIVVVLFYEAIEFFSKVSFTEFFGDTVWTPTIDEPRFGVWPLVIGTLMTAGIAMVVALPLGLLAAIYLSEYATASTRRFVKPALEVLAGVPTIVYGFFALTVITPALQTFLPGLAGFNALAPGLIMGIMIIPMVSSLSEDAIYAVPDALREAAYGLGSAKLPAIIRVIVPSAWSGIAAAFTLAVSRAIGETMIVVMAAGLSANLTLNPLDSVTTVTVQIVTLLVGDQEFDSPKTLAAFALGLVLFTVTLALNIIALRVVRKYREQYE